MCFFFSGIWEKEDVDDDSKFIIQHDIDNNKLNGFYGSPNLATIIGYCTDEGDIYFSQHWQSENRNQITHYHGEIEDDKLILGWEHFDAKGNAVRDGETKLFRITESDIEDLESESV